MSVCVCVCVCARCVCRVRGVGGGVCECIYLRGRSLVPRFLDSDRHTHSELKGGAVCASRASISVKGVLRLRHTQTQPLRTHTVTAHT